MAGALITGATGFVGGSLTDALLRQGREVHVLVRGACGSSLWQGAPRRPVIHVHDGGTKGMMEILDRARPSTVFHLASLVQSEHRPEDIEPLIRSNVLFGTQLLEAAVSSGVRHFINTGTYWQHYQGEGYNPVALYAATKQAFEDILRYYSAIAPLRALSLVLFDTYGPGDRRNKLFSLLRRTEETGKPLSMSKGEQLMDLIYIDDAVRAFCHAETLLQDRPGEVSGGRFAISSGRRLPLREVVAIYEKLRGRKLDIVWGGRPYRPREVMAPWQGTPLPGWKAAVSFDEGLRLTLGGEPSAHA